MLSLRLSSFQLLTLRPFESKLPTLTRLPSELTLFAYPHPSHWKLRFTFCIKQNYVLSFLYFIREQIILFITSAKDKQEVLSLSFSRATVIRKQRYSGEVSKMRRLRGEAVTAPALADSYILQN